MENTIKFEKNNYWFIKEFSKHLWDVNIDRSYWNLLFNHWMIFSYWYHYPLLFKVKWLTICNATWFSNSTWKHIWLCTRDLSVNFDYLPKKYKPYNSYHGTSPNFWPYSALKKKDFDKFVIESLKNEFKTKTNELENIRKWAFRKKEILERRINELILALKDLLTDYQFNLLTN